LQQIKEKNYVLICQNSSAALDRHGETEAKQLHLGVKLKPLWLTYPHNSVCHWLSMKSQAPLFFPNKASTCSSA